MVSVNIIDTYFSKRHGFGVFDQITTLELRLSWIITENMSNVDRLEQKHPWYFVALSCWHIKSNKGETNL